MSDPGDELIFAWHCLEYAVSQWYEKREVAVRENVQVALNFLGEKEFSALGKYQGKISECYIILKGLGYKE